MNHHAIAPAVSSADFGWAAASTGSVCSNIGFFSGPSHAQQPSPQPVCGPVRHESHSNCVPYAPYRAQASRGALPRPASGPPYSRMSASAWCPPGMTHVAAPSTAASASQSMKATTDMSVPFTPSSLAAWKVARMRQGLPATPQLASLPPSPPEAVLQPREIRLTIIPARSSNLVQSSAVWIVFFACAIACNLFGGYSSLCILGGGARPFLVAAVDPFMRWIAAVFVLGWHLHVLGSGCPQVTPRSLRALHCWSVVGPATRAVGQYAALTAGATAGAQELVLFAAPCLNALHLACTALLTCTYRMAPYTALRCQSAGMGLVSLLTAGGLYVWTKGAATSYPPLNTSFDVSMLAATVFVAGGLSFGPAHRSRLFALLPAPPKPTLRSSLRLAIVAPLALPYFALDDVLGMLPSAACTRCARRANQY